MFKETIKYTDYNGVEREEDFYFNINKAELVELEVSESGGFEEMLRRIVAAQNGGTIMKVFKDFIAKSYGVKSPDGREFWKSEELLRSFVQTEAYATFFMRVCTDADYAIKFVAGVLNLNDEQIKEVTKDFNEKVQQLPSDK